LRKILFKKPIGDLGRMATSSQGGLARVTRHESLGHARSVSSYYSTGLGQVIRAADFRLQKRYNRAIGKRRSCRVRSSLPPRGGCRQNDGVRTREYRNLAPLIAPAPRPYRYSRKDAFPSGKPTRKQRFCLRHTFRRRPVRTKPQCCVCSTHGWVARDTAAKRRAVQSKGSIAALACAAAPAIQSVTPCTLCGRESPPETQIPPDIACANRGG
jgi:hypothetical protein